jgi:site-specific recombinase XerD
MNAPHQQTASSPASESLLDGFISALTARNASPRTIQAYKHDITLFICREHIDLQFDLLTQVDERVVRQFFESLLNAGSKLSTLKRMLSSLREFFVHLKDSGKINQNPCASMSIKSLHGRSLSLNDILRIFSYVRKQQETPLLNIALRYSRDESVLLFMLLLGVRQYLIPSLTIDALQRKGSGIALVIGEHEVADVPAIVLSRLRIYLSKRSSQSEYLFTDPQSGLPIDTNALRALRKELTHALNIDTSAEVLYQTSLYLRQHDDDLSNLLNLLQQQQVDATSQTRFSRDRILPNA